MSCDTRLDACWRPSPNIEPRRGGLKADMLLLHYTAMTSGPKAVDWLCHPDAGVSCHYLVDEDGTITQMVHESERAWHAGVSSWHGETDINSCSIGIEIQNLGHALDILPEYPEIQMEAVKSLCLDIIQRHNIPARRVLGHSDVAFGRKVDPGEAFSWEELYRSGIGHWVEPAVIQGDPGLDLGCCGDEVEELQTLLRNYGYGIEISREYDQCTKSAVSAFQAHWRQKSVNGVADLSTVQTLEKLSVNTEDN
ncbi:MAG: N-acetylmuramoyl-L-alanine amidase [Methyloligellaceae bacterium]